MEQELRSLYGTLYQGGYYSKSYKEFVDQFEDDGYKKRVFDVVSKDGLYTQDYDSFVGKYGQEQGDVKKKDDFTLGPTDMDLPLEEDSSDISPEISEEYDKSSFQAKDYLGDFFGGAIDAGVRQGKTAEETMQLIYKGEDISDEDLQEYVAAVRRMQTDGPSKDMIEFQKIAEENGGGLAGFLTALKEKPSAAGEVALTSFAGMITTGLDAKAETAAGAGIGAGAGALIGGVGAIPGAVGGAIGAAGGLLETSMSYTEFLSEELEKKGLEFNPDNIRKILNDEEVRERITNKAIVRGGVIGIVDGMTAGLSGAAAKGIVKTAAKTATSTAGKMATKAAATTAAGVIEGAGGGAGEALARAAVGQEMDAIEIGFEAIGGAPKGIITAPIGIIRAGTGSTYTVGGEKINKKRLNRIIETATPEQLSEMDINIENDPSIERLYKAKVDRHSMSQNIPDDIPAENKEEVINLELKKKELEKKNSVSARARIKVIEGKILELSQPVEQVQEEAPSIPTDDVQGPVEEIKYTLPTDPKEARKDFSIIDNRDGSTTDLFEDGSNRWIVVNDKTNRLVETRTKKDAENLARNPDWEYGEGDVIGERQAPTKMFVAPFYDTKIDTQEQASSVRSTEGYMKAMEALKNNAKAFNLKEGDDFSVTESIGGFINKKGDKIREVSNVIEFKPGTPFEQIEKLAAVLGANTFETQEATIAAEYIDPESDIYQTDEAILEYTLSLGADNTQAILDTLKELEIYDFTLNETNGDLTLLDFGKGTDASFAEMVDSLGDKLKEKGLTYETEQVTKRAVRSSFIDEAKRKKIITDIRRSSLLEGQTGTDLFKAVEQAVDRDAEFNQQTREEYLGESTQAEAPTQEQVTEETTEEAAEEVVEETPEPPTKTPPRQGFFSRYKSFGDALRKFKTKLKLDPKRGNVVIRDLQEKAKGEVSAEGYIALNTIKQIKKLAGDSSEARAVADKVLRGEKLTTEEADKHIKIVAKAQEARASIDRLSQSLIDLNILPKESAENIAKNIGSYLTRSYEAFENPNYVPTAASRRKAKDFLIKNPDMIQELAQKESDETGISFQEALSNQADKYLDNIITPQNGDTFLSRDFKINRGILKRKKDVPKAIREFLGEIESGEEGYYITHLKMSNLLNTARYQKGILEKGLGKFIFEKNDPNRPKNFVEIKGSAYSILDGYVASQDVVDAVIPRQQQRSNSAFVNFFLDLNGLVKGWLTVYNPASYLRNYISTMVMLGVRGDLNSLSGVIQAHKDYRKFWLNQADVNQKIVEYKKAGIIGQNVEAGTVESILNDRIKDPNSSLDAAFNGRSKRNVTARSLIREFYKTPYLGTTTKGVADFFQSTFQAGDDLGKIIAYEGRKRFYADALFDKPVDQLSESQLTEVKEKASNEIKDQYNNYDRVPPAIKALGKTPFIGSFVQFPAEMIRNSVNIYLSAIDNINSGNPKLKADGITRITTFTLAQAGLAVGSTILGEAILGSFDLGSEEEEQEIKDLRNVVAPWSKNSSINVVSTGKNKLSYMDMSANNPYAFVSKMIQQGIDKDNALDAVGGAVVEFFTPFVQEEVLFKALREGLSGKTDSGRAIYYDHNNFVEKGAAIAMHITESAMPGYVKTIQRLLDEDKSILNEIKSLTGFRTTDVKLDTSIYFKMRGVYNTTQSLQSEYRAKAKDGDDQYNEYNQRYQDAFKKAHEVYMSHIRLGLDSDTALAQIRKSMGKNQKFRKSERIAIVHGDPISMRAYEPK